MTRNIKRIFDQPSIIAVVINYCDLWNNAGLVYFNYDEILNYQVIWFMEILVLIFQVLK